MTDSNRFDGEWVDPPTSVTLWERRCDTVRNDPAGRWARFGPYGSGYHHQVDKINRGVYGDGFQALGKTVDGDGWIYVRYEDVGLTQSRLVTPEGNTDG